MPKNTVRVIEAVCDRCKAEGDTSDPRDKQEWGELNLSWNGTLGSRSAMGDGASQKVRGTGWLCMACTIDFQSFMEGPAA